ncbi:protein-tyrosine phosphatase family protein [Roseovarius aestuarii]|nr:protein-tyrosine phosphatase family protein [Roseovarius aestuarii]
MTDFVIYAVPVAGGIVGIAPLPGGGDAAAYKDDLLHMKDWRPALVLSMTTQAEMVAGGAERLGGDLQDLGTRWVHLPVPDFGVPEGRAVADWAAASHAALAALRGRGRVLVHCRGGCGRSGMVALRLMIEAGEAPEAALTRLRAIRPCAVETSAQLRWASDVSDAKH